MYAIVESGGKQHRVEKGTTLLVDRLPEAEGAKVSLRAVMLRDKDVVLDPKQLARVKVEAVVAGHLRGGKLRIFKYKPKKGYRRRAGHRSELTKLEVTEVKLAAAQAKPAAKKEAAPKAKAAAKPKPARKPATKKKPAAKQEKKTDGA